ncbi:N-acetylmuramoyl-L-alanine amidase [Cellulosimicrobium sp. NPDC057862]|uniref:N-acetylmuramoyl-L-alanine amidase n=1 Tax=Actinomycetes TaxID=1760 RepID=UPI00366EF39D
MPRITRLPAALAARGLTVELVDGWQTRGSADFDPEGAVCHWTAGARTGDRPSLKVVRDGRAGLPGPLANVFLARSGVAVVVAAGRANHAGEGGWRGLTGNHSVWGTEAESAGDGDWTDAQRWAYPRINAAFCDLSGFGPDMVCGHSEWAPDRKIDIRDWDMARMRREVAAVLRGDDMALTNTDLNAFLNARFDITQNGKTRSVTIRDALAAVFFYGDRVVADVAAVPGDVWDHRLPHTLAKDTAGQPQQITAGDFQRYEPAEHAATRIAIEKAVTEAVSKIPGTDPDVVRQLVAEGVADGIASIETTVTVKKG